MRILGPTIFALPLLGALLLSSCGGGSAGAGPERLAAAGVAGGQPNGDIPQTDEFIKQAQAAGCATNTNRLFLIDQKMVFWDRADRHCADASYARGLYGATPQTLLCTSADSIAGPRTSCSDPQYRALFDTILNNLDSPDLGLGAGHKVEAIPFLPKVGSPIAFTSVAADAFSGVKMAKNVVIKDAAAWSRLWAEHSAGRTPAPALPRVDFNTQMLVGVFAGVHPSGCREVGVLRVGAGSTGIVVEYDDQDVAVAGACVAAISSGMQVVAIERSDAPVAFLNTPAAPVAFISIDQGSRSNIKTAQAVTIRDAAAWSTLWAAHSGGATAQPDIDFSKFMVLAVFSGTEPNGCYSTTFSRVYRANNRLTAVHTDSVPGLGVMCTLGITAPAHLIRVERSDQPVEFVSQLFTIR
jgi:hypothetical protein